ncbi:B12-binding domain-containing radical SAM protein [Viridibacillus sp. FSL R5-0477]|uniref:Mg-protoporphyrin IX monomethyl ester oxidative cyclase n=1 Tax=Viridibacillus arenosi FSL R5-213 TaxID=1227360 RepID=W4F0R1_9BACL|nr:MULTISPECIES: B12-binding domain-containing radical SAM protein [Viridibacillus]ETT85656.1 Mg-protoporphyrin IX monomethyl ester oxidative cyclase [Viridibacillus arenosi FSL R5-213]OMC83082.1 B12-binding domain-containing radical SAM protein [Viridibacillus sp. FSL H8-0123]OMC88999.1 B12-binding domain-containing radical SAM protein [Viridibacillus sp. FSL H7-0596]OMC93628.1 B12-binding domain-containing radical SAM protein [Viridibacillus arenosi]
MNIVLATLNAKYIHTNIALRYLKSFATPEFDPIISEYTIKDPSFNIVSDIYQKKPDIVGFSCYIWNIEETIRVIRMLKKVSPNTKIILGGPEVSYDVHDWLRRLNDVDYIIMGEGEYSFKQLLFHLNGELPLEEVPGICYLKDSKVIIHPQPKKVDLREMPSPYRLEEDIPDIPKRISYIETSRGCPFSCQFCLSSIEVGVRYFNREKIKEDIRYLMEHGAKTVKFVDRTFNISRSYAMEMFQFLIDEHKPGVVFQFEITADIMRPEVIQFLNDNAPKGLFRFEIGVQSTNDLTNELVKRRQNFEKLSRTVTMVKDGGKIDQHLDLIAGLPEEDYASFRQTFNDVFAMRPEELQLGFLKLLRGTGLRLQAKEYGYEYVDMAPYEIFANNLLTFDDILRIKQAEDVLEKYWNDHRMDRTVEYLVTEVFESPFDFFQEFGTYWEERAWSRIGHQLEDLFNRLLQFLHDRGGVNLELVTNLMQLDYLTVQQFQPRKIWWDKRVSSEESKKLLQQLRENPTIAGEEFASFQLNEKELYKHTLLVPFSLDYEALEKGQLAAQSGYLLTYFRKDNKPYFTTISDTFIS